MKIQGISSNYFINNRKVQNSFVQKQSQQGDVFVSFKSNDYPKRILQDKMKFGISDYMKLSSEEKDNIRWYKCERQDFRRAQTNIELALELKESLDKEYGEGNYVFECIGTSPAPIARVFEFMGIETHYIPISSLHDYDLEDNKKTINKYPENKKAYGSYLKKQGLSSDMLKDNDKHFLFFDYTYSGNSLKKFEKILQDEFDVPKSDRIKYISLNQKLYSFVGDEMSSWEKKHNTLEDYVHASHKCQKIINYVDSYFRLSEAANVGGVPHVPIYALNTIDEMETYSPYLWERFQVYNFCVMDKLNEMGLLKQNPLNNGVL